MLPGVVAWDGSCESDVLIDWLRKSLFDPRLVLDACTSLLGLITCDVVRAGGLGLDLKDGGGGTYCLISPG